MQPSPPARGRRRPALPEVRDLPAAAVEAIGGIIEDGSRITSMKLPSFAPPRPKSPTPESPSPPAAQNRGVGLRELFLPLLGNWTGIEQQAASPVAPATTARAMIVFKLDVGDQVVLQDYRQVRADQVEFSGHGVFMIDRTVVPSG